MRVRRREEPAAGTLTFPGYADIAEIAAGTFATVYRATELGTGRPVALKVVRVADTSPHILEAFKKELSALALLSNHPNVTTLYRSFFTPEGRPVLVLELCRRSLAHMVRDSGPLPSREVLAVGVKVAGALETAHRSGFLHRDLKPQNILVSQFGEPVLADFGVAALQAAAQSTEGIFGFTTLHAAPEMLEGRPSSPSADIYGLASSLYQLLMGKGPFAAYEGEAPASVILRILRDPAPRPPAGTVPVALADLLQNCMDKDPGKRPQTAGELAEALRGIEAECGWAQTPYVVWGEEPTRQAPESSTVAQGRNAGPATAVGEAARDPHHGGNPNPLGQPVSPRPQPLFPAGEGDREHVTYIPTTAPGPVAAAPVHDGPQHARPVPAPDELRSPIPRPAPPGPFGPPRPLGPSVPLGASRPTTDPPRASGGTPPAPPSTSPVPPVPAPPPRPPAASPIGGGPIGSSPIGGGRQVIVPVALENRATPANGPAVPPVGPSAPLTPAPPGPALRATHGPDREMPVPARQVPGEHGQTYGTTGWDRTAYMAPYRPHPLEETGIAGPLNNMVPFASPTGVPASSAPRAKRRWLAVGTAAGALAAAGGAVVAALLHAF